MIDPTHFIHSILSAATEVTAGSASHTAESGGVVGQLGLNWKLFLAQLVNFGIIIFILWKWVFTPVIGALSARTKKIEQSLMDADRIAKEKTEFEKWKDEQMAKARQEASSIVVSAEIESGKIKESTLKKTRDEQEKLFQQAKSQIEQEKQKALQSAKSELADIVTMATEKILREKIDEKKDKQMIKESLGSI